MPAPHARARAAARTCGGARTAARASGLYLARDGVTRASGARATTNARRDGAKSRAVTPPARGRGASRAAAYSLSARKRARSYAGRGARGAAGGARAAPCWQRASRVRAAAARGRSGARQTGTVYGARSVIADQADHRHDKRRALSYRAPVQQHGCARARRGARAPAREFGRQNSRKSARFLARLNFWRRAAGTCAGSVRAAFFTLAPRG